MSALERRGPARGGAPVRLVRHLWAVLRMTRPWFWPLGWLPAYLGTVLATGRWLPTLEALPRWVIACAAIGPFVWGAILAENDLNDVDSDRHNPRKASAPLVTGELSTTDLTRWRRVFVAGAIVAGVLLGPVFALGTLGVLLLGWLYSSRPLRLKTRPGADVALNALAVGVIGPLSGWSLHRDVTEYPPLFVVLGLLLAAALYLPTTVLDVEPDRRSGDVTAAVRWGPRRCYWIGVITWAGTIAVWLACCHLGVLVRRDSWLVQDLIAPLLFVAYAVLIRRPTIARLAVIAAIFVIPALDFLTAYVRA